MLVYEWTVGAARWQLSRQGNEPVQITVTDTAQNVTLTVTIPPEGLRVFQTLMDRHPALARREMKEG